MKWFAFLIAVGVCFAVLPGQAEQRLALVIGNNNYAKLPKLNNAGRDARDMAGKLRQLGFKVRHLQNASRRGMHRAVRDFARDLKQADVGLLYYAGHGIQAQGQNFLIPVDAVLEDEADLTAEGLDVGKIVADLNRAGNRLNIIILDACRDNPLPRRGRSVARGLAVVPVPGQATGTAILYAAGINQKAIDGPTGGNGLFTGALLAHMARPGWPIERVFKATIREVVARSKNRQRPWQHNSLAGEFFFKPGVAVKHTGTATGTAIGTNVAAATSIRPAAAPSVLAWQAVKDSPNALDFVAYLRSHPQSAARDDAVTRLRALWRCQDAPLPELAFIEPDPSVTKSMRRFHGLWGGKWKGRVCSRLAIERILPDGRFRG